MQNAITYLEAQALTSRLKYGLALHHLRLEGERTLPVVKCSTSSHHGFGEAPPLPSFIRETTEETVENVRRLTPTFVGKSAAEALELLHTPPICPSPQTRAALDIAFHDLMAKERGQPLHTLLGHQVRQRVRVSRAIGLHPLKRTTEIAQEYLRMGVTALKLKVGRDVAAAATIRAMREMVGPDIELAIDANEGLTSREALELLEATRASDLAYFEQPVPRDDYKGLCEVREGGVPVFVDESLFTLEDAERLLDAGAADGFALKGIKCGGLRPALEIARFAEQHNLPVVIIDPLGSAVSLNAGLHLAAVLKRSPYAHGLSAGLEVTTPYAPHLPVQAGYVQVPSYPGLGADVVWSERAERLA